MNIIRIEYAAIQELKKDTNRITLTVDKGVSMVVINKQDYIKKAKNILEQHAYRSVSSDPTNRY